jgi:hypothetical protein
MSETKISKFFTPVSTKRSKPDSSPDINNVGDSSEAMENEKVGDLTRGQLMADMSTMLSSLLDQKLSNLATKEDIGVVSRKITDLERENASLKTELVRIREQERKTLSKLVDLEGRSRRNNLIFKGLNWSGNNTDFRYLVRQFCIDELGCDNRVWINRAHPLGRDKKLVIAHIPQDEDIDYILSQASSVKSKGYAVFRDFPVEIRRKRAFLFAVRQEVERVGGRRRMPVEFDHLWISGVRFTWEEDGLKAGTQDGAKKLRELFKHDFGAHLSMLRDKGPRLNNLEEDTRSPNSKIPYAQITKMPTNQNEMGTRTTTAELGENSSFPPTR